VEEFGNQLLEAEDGLYGHDNVAWEDCLI